MKTVIAIVIGILIGSMTTLFYFRRKASGYLRIDRSIPEDNPYIFLELTEGLDSLTKKKTVTLNVKLENFLTQK